MTQQSRENSEKTHDHKDAKSHLKNGPSSPSCMNEVNKATCSPWEESYQGNLNWMQRGTFQDTNKVNPWGGMNTHSPFESKNFVHESEPATLLYEEDENLFINLELPNVDEKDLHIQLIDNILEIRGEKKLKNNNLGKPLLWSKSYWSGNFRQAVNLGFVPENPNSIKAQLRNGMLTIKIKMPQASLKSQIIEIST